jgi:hypothetical protein
VVTDATGADVIAISTATLSADPTIEGICCAGDIWTRAWMGDAMALPDAR